MASAKPTQPPAADMSVLVNRVDALSQKAGLGPIPVGATKLPAWKRWVGGESEYDVKGLRDVVNSNAIMLDDQKKTLDIHTQAILDMQAEIKVLQEAPTVNPFPASG